MDVPASFLSSELLKSTKSLKGTGFRSLFTKSNSNVGSVETLRVNADKEMVPGF